MHKRMDFMLRHIRVDGMRMHVASRGRGPVLVLLHGLANNWEGHIPLAMQLSNNYQVLIPDLPGYGYSGSLPRYSLQIMADALARLIVRFGMRPRAVIGLSMGGLITAEISRSYPDLARSAVIMGPVLGNRHIGVDLSKYVFMLARGIPGGRRALKKLVDAQSVTYFLARHMNMYRFDKLLIDTYGTHGKLLMTPNVYVDMSISVAEYDLDKTLAGTRVPTLLLYGQADKYSSPAYARESVLPYNSRLRLHVVPEAGHIVSLEKPVETATAIRSFLQG
jgi:abhydrolase domain-containing protein 6